MLARFRNRRFQRVRSHGGPSRPQRTSSSDVGRNPASSSKAGGRNFEKEAIGGDGIGPPPPYKMYASGSCSTSSSLDSSPASPVYPRKEHWRIHLAAIIFLIIAAQAVALAFCDFSSIINGYKKAEDELRKWKTQEPGSVPQGAFWDGLWPSLDCRAYGTREYWGVLHNIPKNWTDVDACMNMPFQIKNLTLRRPYRCAYTEGSPHIHGYWMVDWDQPDCKPWHQDFHDTVRGRAMNAPLASYSCDLAGLHEQGIWDAAHRSPNSRYTRREGTGLAHPMWDHTHDVESHHIQHSDSL